MSNARPAMSPIAQILLGLGLCFVALACACGASTAALIECKLDALKVLPDDPMQATVADARDVVVRVRACHRAQPDAGAP